MKAIKLTKNMTTLVDDEDYEFLTQWKWYLQEFTNRKVKYASRMVTVDGKRKCLRMHKVLLNSEFVDHINGNGLDNRRENIRVCSRKENARNRGVQTNNKLNLKGVCHCKDRPGKYKAQIRFKDKNIFIGRFNSPEEAHEAYKKEALKLHGEFAKW